ncbi:hypothetical protein [Cupriavidus agavae]|nr:hypothetical protein [Cupriavidus agavae]
MFNLSVCKLNPLLLPVLVEGEISRGRLLAFAFAYVQGEKRRLYSFQLMRSQEEPVITLTPIQDPGGLLPPAARLVHRVEANGVSEGIRANETVEHPDLECEEDALEFLKRLRSEGHENQQSAERPK